MTCLRSADGKLAVCGGFRKRTCYYFTRNRRAVLFCDSLWYEPNLVLKREKGERLDRFKVRVKKKLGFLPQGFENYRRYVSKPMMRAIKDGA